MRYASGLSAMLIALSVASTAIAAELVITGAKVYPAPGAAPIENASVLIRDNRIVSVGPVEDVAAGKDATVVDAKGGTVLAGF